MSRAKMRLLLAAGLFAAWIGWLAYLAATTTRPIVLSRPQFLVSTLDVIAEVKAESDRPAPTVTVKEVHWQQPGGKVKPGDRLTVANLSTCQGWHSPGS